MQYIKTVRCCGPTLSIDSIDFNYHILSLPEARLNPGVHNGDFSVLSIVLITRHRLIFLHTALSTSRAIEFISVQLKIGEQCLSEISIENCIGPYVIIRGGKLSES